MTNSQQKSKHFPLFIMAIIKTTAIVADIRNKLNGTVFSRNKGGAYMRTKVTPLNPQTVAQSVVRNRLATYSQGWRSLTAAERTGWNDAAPNFPRTNQFGDTVILSGAQLYQSLNNTLVNAGIAPLTDAPTPQAVSAPATLTIAIAAGAATASATFTPTPIPANTAWLMFATPGLSPGISFVKNQYRQIGVLAAAATSPENFKALYLAKFGALPVAGQKVFLKLVPVSTISGQQGTGLEASAIVAA